jgi:hypothetical protein
LPAEATLKDRASKIVVEKGQIVKVSKDKNGIVSREVLTQHWTDWIDYWAVDFNFESKREIVRVKNEESGEWEERWTGDYIFENEWQSFRTKKNRSLELTSVFHECLPGRRKLAVKVVDIFGNDTTVSPFRGRKVIMALHPNWKSPHAILDPAIRWAPADEALRDSSMDKLMPPWCRNCAKVKMAGQRLQGTDFQP